MVGARQVLAYNQAGLRVIAIKAIKDMAYSLEYFMIL
jgi:hypothetical protein